MRFDGHTLGSARCAIAPDYLKLLGDERLAPPFDARRLRGPLTFKNRVWWIEDGAPILWYGNLYSPGGSLYPFDVGAAGGDAGEIAALGKLSHDGGDGPNDYLVCLFRSGRALIYRGNNPNRKESFGLVTRIFVGEPIGDRCLFPYGGDLLATTKLGIIAISRRMSGAGLSESDFITDAVRGLWEDAVRRYGRDPGWEGLVYPDGSSILVNIPDPREDPEYGAGVQLVLDTTQKGWCVYQGMDAGAWAAYEGDVYFAHRNEPHVARAEVEGASTDSGRPIRMRWDTAYSHMPNPGQWGVSEGGEGVVKRLHGLLPQIEALGGTVELEVGAQFDFDDDISRVRFNALTIHDVRRGRARTAITGAGQAVSLIVRSKPGSTNQAQGPDPQSDARVRNREIRIESTQRARAARGLTLSKVLPNPSGCI